MKTKIFAAGLAILLLMGAIAGGLYYMEKYDAFYYTQVDNSKCEELTGDTDMKYQYELKSYNEKGGKRTLKFKASKQLKEGAYLELEVRSTGVHKWAEVQLNEIPQAAQQKLE